MKKASPLWGDDMESALVAQDSVLRTRLKASPGRNINYLELWAGYKF